MGNYSSFCAYQLNTETKKVSCVYAREGGKSYDHEEADAGWNKISSQYIGKGPVCVIFFDDYQDDITCYNTAGKCVPCGGSGKSSEEMSFHYFSWSGMTLINHDVYDDADKPNFPVILYNTDVDYSTRQLQIDSLKKLGLRVFSADDMMDEYNHPQTHQLAAFKLYFTEQFKVLFKPKYVDQITMLIQSMQLVNYEMIMSIVLSNPTEYLYI